MSSNLIVGLVLIAGAFAVNAASAPPMHGHRPLYQPAMPTQAHAPQQTSFTGAVLQQAQTDEAKGLIEQFSPDGLLELQPLAVQLVRKLQSEGNSLEWSTNGAAALIAWSTEECQPLSKEGRKDFSRALVNASLNWGQL